jgi:hypothetical protein
MGVDSGLFFNPGVEPAPDPHKTGFRCGFHFSPAGAPKTWKKPKTREKLERDKKNPQNLKPPERNPKKPETRGKTQWKPEKNRKKHIYKTWRAPDPKPNEFGFECQFSPTGAGLGVKFNPISFFRRSGFRLTRPDPDPLLSLIWGHNHGPVTLPVRGVKLAIWSIFTS